MNVYHRAADLLEKYGWSAAPLDIGQNCAGTAIIQSDSSNMSYMSIMDNVRQFANWLEVRPIRRDGLFFGVAEWNDAPNRTKEEVITKLREFGDIVDSMEKKEE